MNPNRTAFIQMSVFMAVNAEVDSGRISFVTGAQVAIFYAISVDIS